MGNSDLSAIEVVPSKRIVIFFCKRHRLNSLKHTDSLDEHLENGFLGLRAQLTISQCDMDSRLECIVEGLDTVRSQE